MSDLRQFAKNLRVKADKIDRRSGELLGVVLTSIADTVVPETPVKTGKARRNWIPNKGGPATNILEAPGSPSDGGAEAIRNVAAVASTLKSGDTVHLTNNLPYIGNLNNGSSIQAPAMFVQTAVVRAIEVIKGFKLLE